MLGAICNDYRLWLLSLPSRFFYTNLHIPCRWLAILNHTLFSSGNSGFATLSPLWKGTFLSLYEDTWIRCDSLRTGALWKRGSYYQLVIDLADQRLSALGFPEKDMSNQFSSAVVLQWLEWAFQSLKSPRETVVLPLLHSKPLTCSTLPLLFLLSDWFFIFFQTNMAFIPQWQWKHSDVTWKRNMFSISFF